MSFVGRLSVKDLVKSPTTHIRAIHRGTLDWRLSKTPRNAPPCRVGARSNTIGICYAKRSLTHSLAMAAPAPLSATQVWRKVIDKGKIRRLNADERIIMPVALERT